MGRQSLNEAKEILAYELTKLVHGEVEAQKAKKVSRTLIAGGTDDSNMPTTEIATEQLTDDAISILDLLVLSGITTSRSEARRLIQQGGLFINDNKVESDENITSEQLKNGVRIRKGKKTHHKAQFKLLFDNYILPLLPSYNLL